MLCEVFRCRSQFANYESHPTLNLKWTNFPWQKHGATSADFEDSDNKKAC